MRVTSQRWTGHMGTYVWSYTLGERVIGWHIERLPSWKEHAGIRIDGSNSSKCSNTKDNINPTPPRVIRISDEVLSPPVAGSDLTMHAFASAYPGLRNMREMLSQFDSFPCYSTLSAFLFPTMRSQHPSSIRHRGNNR